MATPFCGLLPRLGTMASRTCFSRACYSPPAVLRPPLCIARPRRAVAAPLAAPLNARAWASHRSEGAGNDAPSAPRQASPPSQDPPPPPQDPPPPPPPPRQDNQQPTGTLVTTPNRLLRCTLPLPVGSRGSPPTEPLSLFLHPQQPLSHFERLLQAELPPLVDGETGQARAPGVTFWAVRREEEEDGGQQAPSQAPSQASPPPEWVRWGSCTEVGDFIREAARGRVFAVRVEGADRGSGEETRVTVPSFADRTYYQRMRLRRLSGQIEAQAAVKRACDRQAHRGARRLAQGGFAALVGWWAVVYYVTFRTPYGWDVVEPVTYLASLTMLLGGYLWFLLHHGRHGRGSGRHTGAGAGDDLSYSAAMSLTVSRQQAALYASRGFDVRRWEALVAEANGLRAEIRRAACAYDVDWDEARDVGGAGVQKVLETEQKRAKAEEGREAEVAEAEAEGEGEEEEGTEGEVGDEQSRKR